MHMGPTPSEYRRNTVGIALQDASRTVFRPRAPKWWSRAATFQKRLWCYQPSGHPLALLADESHRHPLARINRRTPDNLAQHLECSGVHASG